LARGAPAKTFGHKHFLEFVFVASHDHLADRKDFGRSVLPGIVFSHSSVRAILSFSTMKFSSLACFLAIAAASADANVRGANGIGSSSRAGPAERRLEFSRICGYEPRSQVTDMAALDLDQQAFEQELFLGKLSQARNVYEQGGHSRSYAALKLIHPSAANFSAGTKVIGKSSTGEEVLGSLVDHATWSTSTGHDKTIKVLYQTSDKQEKYVGCQVGGLYTFKEANLHGCTSWRLGASHWRFQILGRSCITHCVLPIR
jgi:hypothetical protein